MGIILHTQDGLNWEMMESGTDHYLKGVFFYNQNTGWVVGDSGTVLSTLDGGMSWTYDSIPTFYTLEDVWFANPSIGWICGIPGVVNYTNDGGLTWQAQLLHHSKSMHSICFTILCFFIFIRAGLSRDQTQTVYSIRTRPT